METRGQHACTPQAPAWQVVGRWLVGGVRWYIALSSRCSFPCPVWTAAGTILQMNGLSDQQMLRDYTGSRSEAAFAELVRRHVDFVYSAARRMVCDRAPGRGRDARRIRRPGAECRPTHRTDPCLSGWLHRTAQNIAAQTVRSDVRRRVREQEAATMNELLATESDARWEHGRPASRRRAGRIERAGPRRGVAALLRAQIRARDGANARHQRRRRAKTRQPRRGTPARILRQTRCHRRRERTRRRHLRPRGPSRPGRTGPHDLLLRRSGRNDPRHRRNRHQSHRHDRTAKNHYHHRICRSRRHGNL